MSLIRTDVFLVSLFVIFIMVIPFSASAQTSAELQAMINSLLQQVQALQAQLQGANPGTGGTTPLHYTGGCIVTPPLSMGASGSNVTCLQQILAADPSVYPEGMITGYFGALTQAAVQRFQAKNGIVSSGTPSTTGYGAVGPRTAAALNQGGIIPPPPPPPPADISANPRSVKSGETSEITWFAPNAISCSATGPNDFSYSGTSGVQSSGPLTEDSTYRLNCTDAYGIASSDSVTIQVSDTEPSLKIAVSPKAVDDGAKTTVTWVAKNVRTCTVKGEGINETGLTGSKMTSALAIPGTQTSATYKYTLTCDKIGSGSGTVTETASVTVNSTTGMKISANPATVAFNGTSTISWSANSGKVSSCIVTGPGVSLSGITGAVLTGSLKSETTYTLTCKKSGGGEEVKTVVVKITPRMTLNISASPAAVTPSGKTTIKWSSTNATSCTVDGPGISSDGPIAGEATSAALTANSTYVLECKGNGVKEKKELVVRVESTASTARSIVKDIDAMEDAMRKWMDDTKRTTWWTDVSLGGNDPTFKKLVADNAGLRKHLKTAPVPPGSEGGDYKYDNDSNNFACNGNPASGVNVVLADVSAAVLKELDKLIDDKADADCGRLTHSGGTLYYKLSNTSSFVNDAILTIEATPEAIETGKTTVVKWLAKNVKTTGKDGCKVMRDDAVVSAGASGQFETPILTKDTTYKLQCVSSAFGDVVTKSVTVDVKAKAPTCTLRTVNPTTGANINSIVRGKTAKFHITSTGGTTAEINQGVGGIGLNGTSSVSVSPSDTTTYQATVTGGGGSVKCSKTLNVTAAALGEGGDTYASVENLGEGFSFADEESSFSYAAADEDATSDEGESNAQLASALTALDGVLDNIEGIVSGWFGF